MQEISLHSPIWIVRFDFKMLQRVLYFTLLICFAIISSLKGEIIRGRLVDASTKEPLEGVDLICTGGYKNNTKTVLYTSHITTDSLGCFLFFSNTTGKIAANVIGYYPKEVSYIAIFDSNRDTVDVGDIMMKPSEVLMKALEVTQRAKRFTVKGDTIIFNPTAFHLEKGARLEDLISLLPGVETQNGNMYWNGKPIRLTMNGENLFGNSEAIKQLPVEALENIKAYNKASEFSERTRKDDGIEDMVLDVIIKKSFLDKLYGEMSGTYQTPKHFDAEIITQRLSESNPLMITASANNLNKQRHRTMNSSSAIITKDYGQEQYGAAGYQHNWKRNEKEQTLKSSWSASGGVANNNCWGRSRKDTENFYPGETYNYYTTTSYQRTHTLNPNVEITFRHAINVKNTFRLRATFDHKRLNERSEQRSAQFNYNPYETWQSPLMVAFDTIALPGLLVRDSTQTTSQGYSTDLGANANWTHYLKNGSVSLATDMTYIESLQDGMTERYIEHLVGNGQNQMLYQRVHTPQNNLMVNLTAGGRVWLNESVLLNANYHFQNKHRHNEQVFFENEIFGQANSYDDRYISYNHTIDISSTINLGPLKIMPEVSWHTISEHEDYCRGTVDTTATRHVLLWQPLMKVAWKMSKTAILELKYHLRTTQPNIIETIQYRDDSDPLHIREGNPNLRNTHINNLSITYNATNNKRQRVMNIALSLECIDKVIQFTQTYCPQTGVYTSRPEMARGSQMTGFAFNFDQGLGNEFRLKNKLNLQYDRSHGYLARTNEDELLQLNCRHSFSPSESITLSYDHQWLKCSIFTSINMNQLRFSLSPEQNTTLWNARAGINITMEWKHLSIASNLTDVIRQGYIIKSMNDNYWLWNASATWKLLKNKARIKIEVNDILNKMDTFYAQQRAYQNIYSWKEQMHHYANISFTYHFDAKE